MPRFSTQTALATMLGLMVAVPAAAQDNPAGNPADCSPAAFDTDSDRDGMITEAEARTASEREFARFDVDKDEKISRREFIGCFAAPMMDMMAGKSANAGQVQTHRDTRRFAEADRNKDGKVDRAEFGLGAQQAFDATLTTGVGLSPGSEQDESVAIPAGGGTGEVDDMTAAEADEPAIDDPAEAGPLAGVDVGTSPGTGTTGGVADAGEPAEGAPQIVQERFLQSPYADFPTMTDREPTADELALQTARLFFTLDANGDRALEPAEWTAVASVSEHGPAALGALFEKLDTDGDGGLRLTEYVESMVDAHVEARKAQSEAGGGAMTVGAGANGGAMAGASEQATTSRTEMPEGQQDAAEAGDGDGVPIFLYRIYRF